MNWIDFAINAILAYVFIVFVVLLIYEVGYAGLAFILRGESL